MCREVATLLGYTRAVMQVFMTSALFLPDIDMDMVSELPIGV